MSSRAPWLVADGCTTTSLDAELTVSGLEDVGTIATSARDVTRCADACPAGGTVQVAYGLGKILSWTYTGSDTVTVTGPRGRIFEVTLSCDG
jgi:hypothetical protein